MLSRHTGCNDDDKATDNNSLSLAQLWTARISHYRRELGICLFRRNGDHQEDSENEIQRVSAPRPMEISCSSISFAGGPYTAPAIAGSWYGWSGTERVLFSALHVTCGLVRDCNRLLGLRDMMTLLECWKVYLPPWSNTSNSNGFWMLSFHQPRETCSWCTVK